METNAGRFPVPNIAKDYVIVDLSFNSSANVFCFCFLFVGFCFSFVFVVWFVYLFVCFIFVIFLRFFFFFFFFLQLVKTALNHLKPFLSLSNSSFISLPIDLRAYNNHGLKTLAISTVVQIQEKVTCWILISKLFLYIQYDLPNISRLNFLEEAWWFLSVRVFGLLSKSLFPQRFGRYVLRSTLGCVEYAFVAITPRSTLIRNCSTR